MSIRKDYELSIREEIEALESEKADIDQLVNEKKSILQMLMTTFIYIGGKPQNIVKKANLKENRVSKSGTRYQNAHRDIPIIYVEDRDTVKTKSSKNTPSDYRMTKVLQALRKNKRMTSAELREAVGFYNVSQPIFFLREEGHKIYTVQNSNGCFYEYAE